MSSPNDPPLSRRAARQAELVAREAVAHQADLVKGYAPEPLIEPPTAAGSGALLRRRDFRPRAEPPAIDEPTTGGPTTGGSATDEPTTDEPTTDEPTAATESLASKFDAVLDYRTQYPELAHLLAMPQPDPIHQAAEPIGNLEHMMSRRDLRARRQLHAGEQSEERAPANVIPDVDVVDVMPHVDVVDVKPNVDVVDVDVVDVHVVDVDVVDVDVVNVVVDVAEVEEYEVLVVEISSPHIVKPDAAKESALAVDEPPELTSITPHWSDGIHDTDDPFENTFSREVGLAASSTHTNALVLPEMPSVNIGGPVSGTGEIIITGMIDLSITIAATGVRPAVHERPGLDDFDDFDREVAPMDSAPVSALDAVGSHAPLPGLLTTSARPARNTVTIVLIASTVGMAAVAIGLFVVAAVNGLF